MPAETTTPDGKKSRGRICTPAQSRVLSVIDDGGYVREYSSGLCVLFRREAPGEFWHAGAVARRTFLSLLPYLKPWDVQVTGIEGTAYGLKHPTRRATPTGERTA